MTEVLWTMFLLALPALLLGRERLTQWQRGAPQGMLQGLSIWGGLTSAFVVIMSLSDSAQRQPGHIASLIFALSALGWFASAPELARRKSGGEREVAERSSGTQLSSPRRSANSERPLSFMNQLKAQEQRLAATETAPPAHRPVEAVRTPAPVVLRIEQAPGVTAGPPSSMFAPSGGHQEVSLPVELPPPPVAAPTPHASYTSTASQPEMREAQRARDKAQRLDQARLLRVLEGFNAARAEDPPDEALTTDVVSSSEPAADTTPEPASAWNYSTATPPPPSPTGPVTLGSGFNYRPQLVESRLGQQAPAES